MNRGRRPGVWMLTILACAAVDTLTLRAVWRESYPLPGQYRRGFFEEFEGTVGLTLDKQTSDPFFPSVYFDDDGRVSLPPGTSIGVLLEAGGEYQVENDGRGLPPYIAIGRIDSRIEPTEPSRRDGKVDHDDAPATRLVEGQRLEWQDGSLAWSAWDPSRRFSDDEAWLESLKGHCAFPGGGAPFSVHREAGSLSIRLGWCSMEGPLPYDAMGRPPVMAVIAGAEWNLVAKSGGWDLGSEIHGRTLGLLLIAVFLKTVLMMVGAGEAGALAVSVSLMAASVWLYPGIVTLGWELSAVVALLMAGWRGLNGLLVGRSLPFRLSAALASASPSCSRPIHSASDPLAKSRRSTTSARWRSTAPTTAAH